MPLSHVRCLSEWGRGPAESNMFILTKVVSKEFTIEVESIRVTEGNDSGRAVAMAQGTKVTALAFALSRIIAPEITTVKERET